MAKACQLKSGGSTADGVISRTTSHVNELHPGLPAMFATARAGDGPGTRWFHAVAIASVRYSQVVGR